MVCDVFGGLVWCCDALGLLLVVLVGLLAFGLWFGLVLFSGWLFIVWFVVG